MLVTSLPIPIRPSLIEDAAPALAPALSPSGAVSAETDRHLGKLARRAARGDCAARNALHAAFAPRIEPWIRRAQGSQLRYDVDPAIESEDIAQQAFVVFADLLASWDGDTSLSAYVIAYFPWRLRDAIRAMSDPRERRSLELISDETIDGEETIALLQALAADMDEHDGQILLMRVLDRLTWADIATRLEIDKRTAQRALKRVLLALELSLRSSV